MMHEMKSNYRLYFEDIIVTRNNIWFDYNDIISGASRTIAIATRFLFTAKSTAPRNDAPSNSWQRPTSTGKG